LDLGLTGKNAWVLGASRGLGLATAHALLREGVSVAISSSSPTSLAGAREELAAAGAVATIEVDITDPAQLEAGHKRVVDLIGPIDIGVFNGGGPPTTNVLQLGMSGLDSAYSLVLRPAYQFLTLLAPSMMDNRNGVVLFVTSSGVFEPIPELGPSNIMRAGVTALMKTAASELADSGMRVLSIAPGRIATRRVQELDLKRAEQSGASVADVAATSAASIAMGRYGSPNEFGRVAAFICSPAASYMHGTTVVVDGGKLKGFLA
jgi:3-oxoacyl-[acyl-carrier protein] reductase